MDLAQHAIDHKGWLDGGVSKKRSDATHASCRIAFILLQLVGGGSNRSLDVLRAVGCAAKQSCHQHSAHSDQSGTHASVVGLAKVLC